MNAGRLRGLGVAAALAASFVAATGCGGEATPTAGSAEPTPVAKVADPGGALTLEATFHSDRGPRADTEVSIRVADADVTIEGTCFDDEGYRLQERLDPEQAQRLRRAVLESRLFDEWGDGRHTSHAIVWDVSVAIGDREETRSIRAQPEWGAASTFLWRMSNEARDLHRADVHGEFRAIESFLRAHPDVPRVLSPRLALPAIRSIAASKEYPHDVLVVMAEILPPDEWRAEFDGIFGDASSERRRDVLRMFDGRSAPDHERTLVPLARRELALVLDEGADDRDELRDATRVGRVLAGLADAQSLPLFVALTERLSVPDHPYPAEGLVALQRAAVPDVVRLLSHRDAPVRQAAALVVEQWAKLGDAELADLRPALQDRVFPRLHAMEQDVREERWARHYANRALSKFGLSESFRERDRRAAEARKAKRRAEEAAHAEEIRAAIPPAPPKGNREIAGRVLLPDGSPATGFGVAAMRRDGTAQQPWRRYGSAQVDETGRFRIKGLVAGEFSVSVNARYWDGTDHPGLRGLNVWREGVRAGSLGVELKLPFVHSIRGKLLDHDGNPVARRNIRAELREERYAFAAGEGTRSAADTTDAHGRFWLAGLAKGDYDLGVFPEADFDGGDVVAAGTSDLVLRLAPAPDMSGTLSGQVVDLDGEPVQRAPVSVRDEKGRGSGVESSGDGTFAVRRLPAGGRFTVTVSSPVLFRGTIANLTTIEEIPEGMTGLTVRVDPGARASFRVEGDVKSVRLLWKHQSVEWPNPATLVGLPDGPVRIEVRRSRRTAGGDWEQTWLEVGTIRGGEFDRVFSLPPWPE